MRGYTTKEITKIAAGAVTALVIRGGLPCWLLFYRPDKAEAAN
jgi:hypothetical protein